jgi:MOSC domain-containing protein YiiM
MRTCSTASTRDQPLLVISDASITAVCVVHEVIPDPGGSVGRTAIDKRPVSGPVQVAALRFGTDLCCDVQHHGGRDAVAYAYADEDAAWWAAELGREIAPGLFGENLRTSGVQVSDAEIGERWQIGTGPAALVLEVTSPRIPCATFQRRIAEPHWVKRFTEHGAPGAYLRVVRPGPVRAGDPVQAVHRPGHGVSIRDAFLGAEADQMRRLLAAADDGVLDLHPPLREFAAKVVARG